MREKSKAKIIARHAARMVKRAIRMFPEMAEELEGAVETVCRVHNLHASIAAELAPMHAQTLAAYSGTLQGYIENSPELYGRKCATPLAPHAIAGASLDCNPDNGDDIIIPDTSAPLAALDMAQDSMREVSEQPMGNKAPQTPKGRGRPRHIPADEDLTPEAKQAIREAELRFDRN